MSVVCLGPAVAEGVSSNELVDRRGQHEVLRAGCQPFWTLVAGELSCGEHLNFTFGSIVADLRHLHPFVLRTTGLERTLAPDLLALSWR